MFQVEISGVDEMYSALKNGKIQNIGNIEISYHGMCKTGINKIVTTLKSYEMSSHLEGLIFLENESLPILDKKTTKKLIKEYGYDITLASNMQLDLSKGKRTYTVAKNRNNISIFTKDSIDSEEELKTVLDGYAEILSMIVNYTFSRIGDLPDMTYHITQKAVYDIKGRGSLPNLVGENVTTGLEGRLIGELPDIDFDQIGGCNDGKREILRIINDIKYPEIARFFGRNPDENKGYLLTGEPGCGKTLLVKALATKLRKESNKRVKFYPINYADITSIYRGGEAKATEQIFKLAKQNGEEGFITILFFDELHLIGSRMQGSSVKDEALDTLLTHLDGMRAYPGLTVIGATNKPELLDPALIREGRFGTVIHIDKPTTDERSEIFKIYIGQHQKTASGGGNKNLFGKIDMERIKKASDGLNPSQIKGVLKNVISRKEEEVINKIGPAITDKEVYEAFTPITTEDILNAIVGINGGANKESGAYL